MPVFYHMIQFQEGRTPDKNALPIYMPPGVSKGATR
jgi:hypothetical protein